MSHHRRCATYIDHALRCTCTRERDHDRNTRTTPERPQLEHTAKPAPHKR